MRHHHRQIASHVGSTAHTFSEKGVLQSAAAHFGYGRGTREQGHSIMNAKRTGCARLTIEFGKKAQSIFTVYRDRTDLQKEIAKVRLLSVKPNTCMTVNEAITAIGRVRPVMTVERQELRNR